MDVETVKAVSDYGFMTVFSGEIIALLSIAGTGGLTLLYKYIRIKLKKYENRAYRIRMTVPNEHYFFSKIDYIMDYQLPRIRLNHNGKYHAGRTLLFRSLLIAKFKFWRQTMLNISNFNYDKVTREAMGKDVLARITELIKKYEEHWLNSGVPLIVIERFNRWHGMRAELFISSLERICAGRSFDTRTEIKLAILEVSVSLLCHTILDTEKTLGDINGELEGVRYMGHVL